MASTDLKYPFKDGNENLPKDKEKDIKLLKDWCKTQPHLPQLSDEYLHLFLHSNYYKIKETQDNIEVFFTLRATSPELFLERSPSGPAFKTVMEMARFAVIKDATPEGYILCLVQYSDYDVSKFNFTNCLKVFMSILEVATSENGLSPGYIFIFDTKGFSFSHFLRLNISGVRKCMKYYQEALPVRLKGFYTINAPSFMDHVWALFRPFMKSSLIEVIQVYGSDLTEMYKSIPKEKLPKDYGGDNSSMKTLNDDLMKLIASKYKDWLDNEKAPAADMSKHSRTKRKSFFSFW